MSIFIINWDKNLSKCPFLGLIFIHQILVDANIEIYPRLVNFPSKNGFIYVILSILDKNTAL